MDARRKAASFMLLVTTAAALLYVGSVSADGVDPWDDDLGTPSVHLEASSSIDDTSSNVWSGEGLSQADDTITSISVSSTFQEMCRGQSWSTRDTDSDSNSFSDAAVAQSITIMKLPCGTHDCRSRASHNFFRAGGGGFGPNTFTDWIESC